MVIRTVHKKQTVYDSRLQKTTSTHSAICTGGNLVVEAPH